MQAQGNDEEEAALMLGASGWQTFFRITLPRNQLARDERERHERRREDDARNREDDADVVRDQERTKEALRAE